MKYVIKCYNCNKVFAINDNEFTNVVNDIEDRIGEMVSILHRNKVKVSYKSHNHIFHILGIVMRCCVIPDIGICEIEDDAWEVLAEGADNYFSCDNDRHGDE